MMVNMPAQDPGAVKPGWTTTEFYQTLLVNVIAAIVALVMVFKTNFNLDGVQAAVPAVALAAATVAQACYTFSRAKVKAAAQDASARVKSAQATAPPVSAAGPAEAAPGPAIAAAAPQDGDPTERKLTAGPAVAPQASPLPVTQAGWGRRWLPRE